MRYRCPQCKATTGLWEGVDIPGWRSVDAQLAPDHGASHDREAEWEHATSSGDFGCGECAWEGTKRQLERIGIDDEPLPVVHPGQLTVTA